MPGNGRSDLIPQTSNLSYATKTRMEKHLEE